MQHLVPCAACRPDDQALALVQLGQLRLLHTLHIHIHRLLGTTHLQPAVQFISRVQGAMYRVQGVTVLYLRPADGPPLLPPEEGHAELAADTGLEYKPPGLRVGGGIMHK